MTIGTIFTLFVVPVFYMLIAAEHKPKAVTEEYEVPRPWRPVVTGIEEALAT